jgi:alpha-L-fucosidase
MTICRQWSWKPNDEMKSRKQCIQTLLRTAGGDGNLLFNVGPMPDGRIEPRQVERLKEMGAWLKQHGDGVYGTRGGPFKPGMWGASTCKDDHIYLFIMNWPAEGPLLLPPISVRITGCQTLTDGDADILQTDDAITVHLPVVHRDEIATVVMLTVEGRALDIEPASLFVGLSGSWAYSKRAIASNVLGDRHERFGPDKAFDDDPETSWATDQGTTQAWLEVDLGQPRTTDNASIREAHAGRVRRYQLEYWDAGQWKSCHTGLTLDQNEPIKFAPITAQRFRLNITSASNPTISEFQLFGP